MSSFEPVAVAPQHAPPRADVDPSPDRGWFARVLPVILANRVTFLVAVTAGVSAMLCSVAMPAVLGFAINDALGAGALQQTTVRGWLNALVAIHDPALVQDGRLSLETYVAVLLLLGLVRSVGQAGYRYGLYTMAYRIETDLRSIVYDHLTRLSFSFFDRVQSGQIISRANSDIRSLQMFLTFAPMMIMTFLSFSLALSFMLSIHVGLTVAAIVALPGVFAVGVHMRKLMFPLSWMNQSRLADLATIVDENINGVRIVKSFAAEKRQVDGLAAAAQRVLWAAYQLVEMRARHAPLMENIARLGPAAVLLYGGWLVMEGHIEGIGTLITFNTFMIMLQAPFRILGFFLAMSQRAKASAARIFEILDEPVAIHDRDDAVVLENPRGEVELRDVRFGYAEGEAVLDGFSLHVQPGETVALVGRTGCGKSTVARLLSRFYDVDDGAVCIDGHDVRTLTLTSLRARVGLVLDEPFLFSTSVRDNIAYGRPDATHEEVVAAARAARADGFIEALQDGYDTVVGERGYTLSGGQRQRIALARVFLLNPPLLILDDATSAIDVKVEAEIHDALAELLKGRTTIVIAHRLSTIRLADRVALMEGGKVIATGTHAQLLESEPRYGEVLAQAEAPAEPETEPDATESDREYRARMRKLVSGGGEGGPPPGPLGGGLGP